MRHLFLLILSFLLLTACNSQSNKLEDAFILSLKKRDFTALKNFMADREFYNSLDKMPKRSEKEIEEVLNNLSERTKKEWQEIINTVIYKNINLDKVIMKEVIYYDPFPNDDITEALIINYEYNGKVWDDIQFMISKKTGKTILLGVPNPTRAFSMSDPSLRATNEAKASIEMSKPEFKKEIQELSGKLIDAVKTNNLDEFGQHLIYRGDDENKKWKTALNINDSLERRQAADLMKRVSRNIEDCDNFKVGKMKTEKESEGTWIIWQIECGKKIVSLAYLRINGKLLLGDTDMETKD